VTYVYQSVDEISQQTKFSGERGENPIEFIKQCESNMETVGNNLSEK
jgi:hypothetical protein